MKQVLKRMLLVALLCVPWVTQAQTDTLTVADGTETNSNVPFYGLWMDANQHNQVLYPASMTATIVGDSITGMGFYMSSTNSSPWGSTVTISLGISSNASLTGLDNTTALTQVWQGTVNGQGDIWIHFDNAYAFQGGNLLVDIQTTAGTYQSASFYGISQTGGSYYSYNSSGGVHDFIPKTSFLHVDGDFTVCLMPTNLVAEIDSNTIAISWNPAAGVIGYNVYMNDSLVAGSVTDTFYVFDYLTSNTAYSVSVTSDCGDGESPAIGGTFRTECSLMELPFFTSFEDDPYGVFPPCWTRTIANGTDPSVNTVFSHTGSQSMYLQANMGYNLFASQSIPLSGDNIKVDFWARLSSYYEGWIQAGVMTNPTQENTFIPLLYINDMAGEWKHYNFSTHDLDANTTYYIAFKYYGTGAYNSAAGAIDDITISATDGCAMPRYAAVDTLDTAYVSFHWVAGSSNGNYEVAYGTSNDLDAANVISAITDTAYTVTGLNPATMYYFWVRNICTSGDTTLWYYVGKARTACSDGVNAPYVENFVGYDDYDIPACWNVLEGTDNYGTNCPYISSSSSYIYFYPKFNEPNLIVMPYVRLAANAINIEVNGYYYPYYPCNFEVGYVTNPDSASTFTALGTISATSATDFEFNTSSVEADSIWIAFRASTTSQYSYAYLNSVRISALSSCVRPDYLAIDTVGADMAELHCNNTGADNFEVRYATVNNVNAATALSEIASDTAILLSDLTPSTHYYTWVRAICGADSSDWRQGPDFTTMCGEEFCLLEMILNDSYGDGWNGNAINVYTNGVFQMSATIDNGTDNTVIHPMCEGDTVSLIWVMGSYVSETSFQIQHAGVPVLSAGGSSYSNGDTVLSIIGCPSCMPVANVVVLDSLTTDESITIAWTPNSADDSEWVVSLDGQVLDGSETNSYTFSNLTSRTEYVIGVATLCDGSDTSDWVYINASTLCTGNNCALVIDMHDSFGDGWNGHAINVLLNGTAYASATIASGNSNVFNFAMCDGDTIALVGVSGSYPGEVSFEIYHGGGILMQGTGSNLNGDTLAVLDGCPSCVTPSEIVVSNITTTTATLNWNVNVLSTGWHVTVNSAMAMLVDTVITSVPYTVTGLQSATGYTVMVSSICGNDTASVNASTFITACDDITLPWSFVAANDPSAATQSMPLCWYTPQAYVTSYDSYPYNYSYEGAIYIYAYNGVPCMAATPRIPTAGNNIYVRFTAYGYVSGGAATAGIMTDVNDPTTYIPLVNISGSDYTEFEFTTDAVAGLLATDTVYVAFQATGGTTGSYGGAYIYLHDVYVQVIPNCARPDNIVVSNVTDNSATLTWTNTGANNYTITYDDTAFVVSGNTVTLTGLNGGTTYSIDVQGNCTTDSSLISHVSFTTVCTPITLPWNESFENVANYGTPNCWTFYNQYPDYSGNLSPYVYNYNSYAHTGDKSLEIVGTSINNTMAVSPVLTGEAMNTLYVSFWVYGSSSYGFEAGLMTDASDTSTFIPLLVVPSTDYNITQYSFQTNSLTNTDSSFHFAIRYTSTSTYSGNIYIDDITVMRMPDCSEEFTSAAISGVANDGATLNWTPGLGINANSSYTVTLMDANYGVVSTFNDATSPMTFTGLNSGADYYVMISLTCGGNVTAVSDTLNFTTLCNTLEIFYSYDSTMDAEESVYAPMGYSYWKYSYTQTIIDSARMVAGDIVGFAFLPTTVTSGDYYTHMDVYMANVSESDLSADWITPDSAHVFTQVIADANMCYDTADWQQHIFTQPFAWDGHSNVLISVRRSHGTYSSGASFSVHSDSTTVAKTRYSYNDNNIYDINDPSAASTNGGSDDYVSDFKFLVCGESCPAPLAYATVDDYQGATITWTSDADTVEYALKAAADASYPAATRVANNGSFAATNLAPATTYMFHVRAICEGDDASVWTEVTFVTDSLPCFVPDNLHTTALGYTTATLAWDANASQSQWSIEVWNTAGSNEFAANTNPFTVTGLSAATTYYAAVKAVCGNGLAESEYSDTIQFTTNACGQVTGVTVNNITENSAVVSWTATGADRYILEYGDQNFSAGHGTSITVDNATTYTLTNLEQNYDYSVFVRAVCEEGVNGEWSEQVDFTTLQGGTPEGIDLATANSQLSIYPNPATDATVIALSGINGDVTITIVDMNGRTVKEMTASCGQGDCTKRVELSDLAQGAYFVRVNGDNLNMVRKLIVK